MSALSFLRLNPDWNAEPNDPDPKAAMADTTLRVAFYLNHFAYEAAEGEMGILSFPRCSRWRWDSTNDHGWYSGEGRFANEAPAWGEFYEVVGNNGASDNVDWEVLAPDDDGARHFLFYFRDEAIECVAADWSIARLSASSTSAAIGVSVARS